MRIASYISTWHNSFHTPYPGSPGWRASPTAATWVTRQLAALPIDFSDGDNQFCSRAVVSWVAF
jgi:hypothetical protein